ncbi:hypothetical protein HK097_003638 [Rhizophlyctis rosea]|uniref:Uncharacterized protein n=1 Tax=Rhizophlyctis rosea TaxID=64517 RepID=A0AAD5WX44_9FUNG|nr:hypothetical protein HK097_003638 [Rhizophlyctis rosea]
MPATSEWAGSVGRKWIKFDESVVRREHALTENEDAEVPKGKKTANVLHVMAEERRPVERIFAGAKVALEAKEGKVPTPLRQLDEEMTGGRVINVGDLPELEEWREEIDSILLEHLDEFLEPGSIARTMTGVKPMEAHLDPTISEPLPKVRIAR